VLSLQQSGLMMPAGQAKIDAAIADGSWTALDAVEALEMPADLQIALRANAKACENFDAFPPGAKKLALTWIATAKRAETRAARIEQTVKLAAKNIRANAQTKDERSAAKVREKAAKARKQS
jgi:uncharacterized protein YdeI (YjbR/CyaY-like superfamily)